MANTDRFNVNTSLSKNWEHLQNKFLGTGHPDITRHEWAANHHRDTNATLLGHHDMLLYAATAEGVAVGRMRYNLMERMLSPVGPPPAAPPAALLHEAVMAATGTAPPGAAGSAASSGAAAAPAAGAQ